MQPDKSSLSKDDNGKSQSTVIRSIVNRRLLCVSRIEHTIECSNYTLLAKGRASEIYTIFDNETSLPPSETPSPRPGIAIDVRIQSMAIMSSPFLRYKRIILSESIRSDPLFHRFRGKTKDLARPVRQKNSKEKEVSLISSCSFQVRSTFWPKKNPLPDTIASLSLYR